MSAIPPKADIGYACRDVRFVPKADIALGPRHVRFTPKSGHSALKLMRYRLRFAVLVIDTELGRLHVTVRETDAAEIDNNLRRAAVA